MQDSPTPRPAINGFQRTELEKLRLAVQVILDSAPVDDLVSGPLEAELEIFKDRVEFLLLLPAGLPGELPWQGGADDHPNA